MFRLSYIRREECPQLVDCLNSEFMQERPSSFSFTIEIAADDPRVERIKGMVIDAGFQLIPPSWTGERTRGKEACYALIRAWSPADLSGLRYVRMHADAVVTGMKDPTPEGVVPVKTDWARKNVKKDFGADNANGWLLSARAAELFRAVGVSDADVLWRPTIAWAANFAGMKQLLQPLDWWSMKPLKTLPPHAPGAADRSTRPRSVLLAQGAVLPTGRPGPVRAVRVAIGYGEDRLFDSLIISKRLYEAIRVAKLKVKPEYFSPVWNEGVDRAEQQGQAV